MHSLHTRRLLFIIPQIIVVSSAGAFDFKICVLVTARLPAESDLYAQERTVLTETSNLTPMQSPMTFIVVGMKWLVIS